MPWRGTWLAGDPGEALVSEFQVLLNAVLPVLGVMAAGFCIRRIGWLTEEADASLMRVVINLLTPCLV